MSKRIVVLQASTSTHDITTLLATQDWELIRVAHPDLISTCITSDPALVGIAVFDEALECAPEDIEQIVRDSGMEWIAVLPPESAPECATAQALAASFFDYHTLPVDPSRLIYSVGHARGKALLRRVARPRIGTPEGRYGMIGRSPSMLTLYGELERIMRARASVLITGESGVGKELAARAIHEGSSRRGGPFVPVNCGALPHSLVENLLFGHEKGAFTGAGEKRIGSIEAANGGTIFLDEIGDLTLPAQASLLRFLQESTITRVGSTREIRIDVRVIAATHVDLREAVRTGRFRPDLFYRLNVLSVEVPPLRDRDNDCILLAKRCLAERFPDESPDVRGFTDSALRAIQEHRWPGNVRELLNGVRRAMVMCEGTLISPHDLQLGPRACVSRSVLLSSVRSDVERSAIEAALSRSGYNSAAAARDLGISRVTLYRLRRRLGIVLKGDEKDLGHAAVTPISAARGARK